MTGVQNNCIVSSVNIDDRLGIKLGCDQKLTFGHVIFCLFQNLEISKTWVVILFTTPSNLLNLPCEEKNVATHGPCG